LLLALTTFELAETRHQLWWVGILLSFTAISLGYVCSGSTFTTLIYERAPEHQQGRAIGLAWTLLLAGYAFAGILFGRLLPHYTPEGLLTLFVTVVGLMLMLWYFAIWGEERRYAFNQLSEASDKKPSFLEDFRAVWSKPSTRVFFLFIGISFVSVFAQDQILEPFGAQVFGLSTGETSRFAAFWGGMALISSFAALMIRRYIPKTTYALLSRAGLWTLFITFLLLVMAAFTTNELLIRPTLILFGFALGLWNIGTWGLMVSVSYAEHAGTYFGLWTMASLIFRGGGSVLGAIFRDVSLYLTDDFSIAYGGVFAFQALGILVALYLLNRVPFETKESSPQKVLLAVGAD
jgi:BCD family chlorophyll transporter-like MFS transporter